MCGHLVKLARKGFAELQGSSTLPRVEWTGHSLGRGGASAAHAIGVSIVVIMAWDLWKSLASALLQIDVSVCPSSEALFFFGHLLARFNLHQATLLLP